ncbi:MAG: serine/threonine protein kinase, partial [Deltaproteobacteria bacterium]|nr:serine/threonine protein kinase [Deltaproteobacteria bacterium]
MTSPLLALHAALERLDTGALRDLGALVLDLDALDPSFRLGAAETARHLVARAGERHAIPALCDALGAKLGALPEELTALLEPEASADLELGDELGPYLIVRRLGRGRLGTTYLARAEGLDVRLKVLSPAAARDATAVQRYLTLSRMVGAIDHPGLPGPISTGLVDGVPYVAHPHIEGQTLAARIARTSAMHVEEARPVLRSILEALEALHAGRLVHGALRAENVLLRTSADGTDSVVLLDAGAHLLDLGRGATREPLARMGSARSLSPEQIHGETPDHGSDLYSFGAIAYEVLSGQPPFPGATLAESLLGHVARPPRPFAEVAPPGWVGPALAEFVQGLLSKRAAERPAGARSALGAFEGVGADDFTDVESVDDEELEARARALLSNPKDSFAEEELVAAIREGGSPRRVAESLRLAADLLDPEESPADLRAHLRLLARAARLYATTLRDEEAAEALYARLAELDPEDAEAAAALDRLRRRLGKYEDIVESLLSRCEALPPSPEKGALWAQIGRLYFAELDDAEQALVAFTQAFCEHPLEPAYVGEIERLAARVPDGWTEVLGTSVEAARAPRPEAATRALYLQLARWYESKVGRPDLALPCYAALLGSDP